tara:strand:+ start:213 stop:572 length:360 start_codon:yes stop_codon:yes gene_type:complete
MSKHYNITKQQIVLVDGTPIYLQSIKVETIGNNFTGLHLHHCSLPVDTAHIKLFEILSPTDEDHFIYYQKFIECSVRASSSQLELFIQNLSDFDIVARSHKFEMTDDPKIYSRYLLEFL